MGCESLPGAAEHGVFVSGGLKSTEPRLGFIRSTRKPYELVLARAKRNGRAGAAATQIWQVVTCHGRGRDLPSREVALDEITEDRKIQTSYLQGCVPPPPKPAAAARFERDLASREVRTRSRKIEKSRHLICKCVSPSPQTRRRRSIWKARSREPRGCAGRDLEDRKPDILSARVCPSPPKPAAAARFGRRNLGREVALDEITEDRKSRHLICKGVSLPLQTRRRRSI